MKKWVSMIGISVFAIMIFAGCGQLNLGQGTIPSDTGEIGGAKESSSQGASSLEDNTLSQQEKDILQYEQKYYSGEFTMEDYHALAKLYAEQGKIRKQRDMLEQSLRLYDDREAFELLQNLCVNLEEEDEVIRQQAVLLCQNLETPEYKNEAIHVIESEGWFETLMPKLGEGTRKYFLQKDGQSVISICIGYDENQKSFSNVWISPIPSPSLSIKLLGYIWYTTASFHHARLVLSIMNSPLSFLCAPALNITHCFIAKHS